MFFKRKSAQITVYEIPLPPQLIQSLRACQAIMEAGVTVSIREDQKSTYEHLNKFFPTNYVVKHPNAKRANITFSHPEPYIKIGDVTRPLLFSNGVFERCQQKWKVDRDLDFVFQGYITPKRSPILEEFTKRIQHMYPDRKVHVSSSTIGRAFPTKAWDDEYWEMLGRSKFIICPDGDFTWTYRFFEAVMCKAIPVVENSCAIYEGFEFFTMTSKDYSYSEDMAVHNLSKAKEMLLIESDKLKRLITEQTSG